MFAFSKSQFLKVDSGSQEPGGLEKLLFAPQIGHFSREIPGFAGKLTFGRHVWSTELLPFGRARLRASQILLLPHTVLRGLFLGIRKVDIRPPELLPLGRARLRAFRLLPLPHTVSVVAVESNRVMNHGASLTMGSVCRNAGGGWGDSSHVCATNWPLWVRNLRSV